QRAGALFPTRVIDDQVYTLMPRQVADDLGIDPWNRLELTRPVAAEMRPGEPCGLVRLPVRGHAVALRGGGKFGVLGGHCSSGHSSSGYFPSIMRLVMGA